MMDWKPLETAPWTWHVNTLVGHSSILFQSFPLPVWIHRMLVFTSPGLDKASLSIRLSNIPNDLWYYHHPPPPPPPQAHFLSLGLQLLVLVWEVGCSFRKSLGMSSWECVIPAYFLSHCFHSCLDVNSLCTHDCCHTFPAMVYWNSMKPWSQTNLSSITLFLWGTVITASPK